MLDGKSKLTKCVFLACLLFNFLVYPANSTVLPVVKVSSLRIELLNEKADQTQSSSWNYSKLKVKTTANSSPGRVHNEFLAYQNRRWKTKFAVLNIISLEVHKPICPLRLIPQEFADEHPVPFQG